MAFRLFYKISNITSCFLRLSRKNHNNRVSFLKKISIPALFVYKFARCETTPYNFNWDEESLQHEFLIKQSCTVNVNSASQLLTVTLVALQDTSRRLRESLSQEISLVRQALEWGDKGTPEEHWDRLVATRGGLEDLQHNLRMLESYMEYAEKLATVVAEISYLSGNIVASDTICERINQANRAYKSEMGANQALQTESLDLQRIAIISSPQLEELLKTTSPDADVKQSHLKTKGDS